MKKFSFNIFLVIISVFFIGGCGSARSQSEEQPKKITYQPLDSIKFSTLQNWYNQAEITFSLDSLPSSYVEKGIPLKDTDLQINSFDSIKREIKINLSSILILDSGYSYLASPKKHTILFRLRTDFHSSFFFLNETEIYELAAKFLFDGKIDNLSPILKTIVKSGFILEESLKNIEIRLDYIFLYWDGNKVKYVDMSNSFAMTRLLNNLHSLSSESKKWNLTLHINVQNSFSLNSRSNFTTENTIDLNDLIDSKITQFLRKKYGTRATMIGDNEVLLKKVQGEVSGKSNIWENVEIFVFNRLKKNEVNIIVSLDGDWKEASPLGSGPTDEALASGGKLDKEFQDELRHYGYKLIEEIKTFINDRE